MYISTINKQSLSTTNFLIADIISLNCALTALNGFLPDEYQKTSIFLVWSRLNYSDLDPTFLGLMYNISKYNDIQIIAADMVTFLQQRSLNSFRSTDSNIEYFNEIQIYLKKFNFLMSRRNLFYPIKSINLDILAFEMLFILSGD